MTLRVFAAAAAVLLSANLLSPAADAAGCIKGAVVGGVVGHVAGHHGLAGAAVGCAVGHHEASKDAKAKDATPSGDTGNGQPAPQ